ncbi:amino acid ABC transporter membrane protein 1, PAAT family (TC 3.A.1.3.-) [Modicisalibacter muralis]|uniref:Amino acid ABC transporter membrane protein 1, PAAT family (TC 3.A.1.3.-) n=1 Tax=Modicisalibacter muralis TaxID=119000 RepID=A0A1G9PLL1_9GAMM|nr:amino acid ABC transporter permease [Halomonas muralis]SDL99706.1 amino acid ABC transporter membrane protein 1, PAAT family (TC 3.A.1.3.-) [Halomonas muralis]
MGIYEVLVRDFPFLLKGLGVALILLAALLVIGFVLGLAMCLIQLYGPRTRLVQWPLIAYERVFRGIPIIIMLFIFYYGLAGLLDITSFAAAILALGFRSAAYQSQIFRSAFQSVPTGQMTAARAMGMSKTRAIRYILFPQAMRYAIGPWTNEFSSEIKETSLAYVIGVVELTRQAHYIISSTQGNVLIVFAVVALMYFIVNKSGNSLLYGLERKLAVPGFGKR